MASYNTVITNEGAALLASVIANQGTLTFSEMRFSTTDYDGVEQTLTVGTFGGVFITAAAAGSVVDSTTIKVDAQFDNSGIVGDHPLYSIGIVGTDGNTTALIAVCTTTNPDIIRAALTGVSTYAFNVNLAVSSTSNITVTGTTAAVLYDTDIVNHLNSTDATKPLSANMGHVLGEEVNAIVNVYGAKNLYNPEPSYSDNPHSENGLTFTINADKSVTVSGIASAATWFRTGFSGYKSKSDLPYGAGCILSGESNGSPLNYATYVVGADDTLGTNATNYTVSVTTGEVTIPDRNAYSCVLIFVESGTDFTTPHTFYPMIRDERIVDPTYEPYAETNLQLTANKANRADLASLNLTGTKNTTGATITAGQMFYLNGQLCVAVTDIAANATFTLNTNYLTTNVNNQLMVPSIVDSEVITTYPTGIVALNGVETVKCCKYSNGQVVISGCITVANGGNGLAAGSVILTIPDRFRKPKPAGDRWLTIMSYMVSNPNGQPYLNVCILHSSGDIQIWNRGMADDEVIPIFITY